MFAFHIPVAALQKQQRHLEILGENIANINTTGYKSQRLTFVETLGSVSSVDQIEFKQGQITSTGNTTDMAINGNGFFVIKKDNETVYTRNGAFHVNANGRLVNNDEYVVQGWMENITPSGVGLGSSSLGDIIIDSTLVIAATETSNVYLSGNLNAGLESIAEVWMSGSQYTKKATLVSEGVVYPLTVTAGTNDQFVVTYSPKYQSSVTETLTLSAGNYADVDSLVTELNTQISNNANLRGKVEVVNQNGALKFRVIDGLSGTILKLNAGTNDVLADLGFDDGATSVAGELATADTELNDLLQITSNLVDGDTLNINGLTSDGTTVSSSFEFGSAADGTTLGDLIDAINEAYSGSSVAEVVDGKIVLTDSVEGDSATTISITAASGNTGQIIVPSFVNSTAGQTGRVSTSIVIYDSLGKSHNLTIDFVKTRDEGVWAWSVSGAEEEEIIRGGSGRAIFDNSGNFLSFIYDGGVDAVTIDPRNGANQMSIKIHGESNEGFSGISQFDSVSTLYGRHQDGRQAQTMNGFYINNEGAIIGLFGTGDEVKLGQIALATFKDYQGMQKTGNGYYVATDVSGIPQIGTPESLGAALVSESLEISNVDLADQFTKMIEAQRAYQAAARVISTYQTICDETTRLLV